MGESSFERRTRQHLINEAIERLQREPIDTELTDQYTPYVSEGISVAVDVEGEPTGVMPEAIFMNGGQPVSGKPTNVMFNTTELLDMVATSALSAGAAVQMPVLAPAAVLAVLTAIKRTVTVSISKRDAVVFYAIHTSDPDGYLSQPQLPTAVRAVCRHHDIDVAQQQPLVRDSVETLRQIDAIEVQSTGGTKQYRTRERCEITL